MFKLFDILSLMLFIDGTFKLIQNFPLTITIILKIEHACDIFDIQQKTGLL